jgi:hypothetical protein
MKVIETAWQDFALKVIPAGAPPIQITESRKAFYAGAMCLLDSLMKVLGPGKEPTESDLLIMDGVQKELAQFLKDLQTSYQGRT